MSTRNNTVRSDVWQNLREVARPDSRFHFDFNEFIPDYQGSDRNTDRLLQLSKYQSARTVFITPDNNLVELRARAIDDNKTLIMPTYGIRRGFLQATRDVIPHNVEVLATTLDGMERIATPISLDEIKLLGKIDILFTGASVISLDGVRFGKGHGFFDLEWAMMREIGVVTEDTPVVAVAHDCQVLDVDLDPQPHDTVVDYIVTPTQTITIPRTYQKPVGINWDILSKEMVDTIPPLQELRRAT